MNDETQICPTCRQRLDPGAGYRMLSVGEIRTNGDEYHSCGMWRTMRKNWLTHRLQSNSLPTRRKIPVSNHDHATDSGQRAYPTCGGNDVDGHVVVKPAQVCPGVGYRLLEIGETIRKSDEALFEGCWKSYNDDGIVFDGVKFFFPRRRKIEAAVTPEIDPGAGFRFLESGETISQGDEYNSFHDTWLTTSLEGRKVNAIHAHSYRRKIETAVEPGEGYRLLAPNEILEVEDELFSPFANKWEKFFRQTVGMPLCPGITARRRKIVPKQYRLLAVGEMLKSTDEIWTWPTWGYAGFWKRLERGLSVVTTIDPPVRREIDSYIGGPA